MCGLSPGRGGTWVAAGRPVATGVAWSAAHCTPGSSSRISCRRRTPVVLHVVLLDALDLLEFPVDERRLVLVAFPLFSADAVIILSFLSESQQFVL